jgi:hypothetical protein
MAASDEGDTVTGLRRPDDAPDVSELVRNPSEPAEATMKGMMFRQLTAGVLALTVALTACASPDDAAKPAPWGSESTRYFEKLSMAYTDNDFYGVLDFYAASAGVEMWRRGVLGGLVPVSDMLRWNSGDLGEDFEAVYLSGDGALRLVLWPRSGDQGAIASTIEGGLIARETVFELAAVLDRSLRASPDVIATYEGLYKAFAEAWSSESADHRARLYAAEASVHDTLSAFEVSGREAIAGSRSTGSWSTVVNTTHSGGEDSAEGPSVYLGPRDYAQDPQRAVGVYEVEDSKGCTRHVAVHWILESGLIVEEHRYSEVESFRRCAPGRLPAGWWTGLALPEPSDQIVTGVVHTAGGQEIAIHNGTERLEKLVRYGLERFASADLDEPILDTVTFEPSRNCVDRSGRVLDTGVSRDLFLCMYESDLCPDDTECAMPGLAARVAILHELGHVWILDRVGDETKRQLLSVSGRETWGNEDMPWADRGVEYSAEVLAWGLLDQAIPMVRFAAPPCAELTAAFEVLTGNAPMRDAADCPGN